MITQIVALALWVIFSAMGKARLALIAFIIFLVCNMLAIMAYAVSNMNHKPQSTSKRTSKYITYYTNDELEVYARYYANYGYNHPSFNPRKVKVS